MQAEQAAARCRTLTRHMYVYACVHEHMYMHMYTNARVHVCGHAHVLVCARMCTCVHACVCVCVVGGCVGSEAVRSCKSHGHTWCSQVRSCESAGVSATTVSSESVVAVGVDGKDRVVVQKVGRAQRVPWSGVCEDCVT